MIKTKKLSWWEKHAYVVADRFDLLENDQGDRQTITFYGYVWGTHFNKANKVHISGLGDYPIDEVTRVSDPVPVESSKQKGEGEEAKKKRRTLKDWEKIIYAPFSNFGAMNFDRSSGFITIPDRHVIYTKLTDDWNKVLNYDEDNEGQKMVRSLQEAQG